MTRPNGTADWKQTLAAEQVAISLGILDRCPHQGVMGPCTRAQHHDLPHAVADLSKTAGNGTDGGG